MLKMQRLSHIELPSEESFVKPLAKAVYQCSLIPGGDYTAVSKGPLNHWTSLQRVILALLASYDNSWRDIKSIFNAYFSEQLVKKHGLSVGAVSTMWHSMKLGPDEKAALKLLKAPSLSLRSRSFETETQSRIEGIANALKITLTPRTPGSVSRSMRATTTTKPIQRKRKYQAVDVSTSGEESAVETSSDDSDIKAQVPVKRVSKSLPQTPTKSHPQHPSQFYPTPQSHQRPIKKAQISASTTVSLPTAQKKLAALGFRGHSDDLHTLYTGSSFRSGAFRDAVHVERPPDSRSITYLKCANMVGFPAHAFLPLTRI